MTTEIRADFNERRARQAFDRAADGVLNDLALMAALAIRNSAPQDTGFMAESVRAVPVGAPPAPAYQETRVDRSGRTVRRNALQSPSPPQGGSGVHVGADYALRVELERSFTIGPAMHISQVSLPAITDRNRLG